MILVLWAALTAAAARLCVAWKIVKPDPLSLSLSIPILLGIFPLPLLGLLIKTFDLPGPVRDWYHAACSAFAKLFGGALFLLSEPMYYVITGRVTRLFPLYPICGAICLWIAWGQLHRLWPSCCPACKHRALFAVDILFRPGYRCKLISGADGWCAMCGAEYLRKRKGWVRTPAVARSTPAREAAP